MSTTRATTLTYAGLNLMAACQTGKELHFTRIVTGNGEISSDQNIRQLTGMVSPKLELPILKKEVTGTGTAAITAQLENSTLAAGFFARETGIFAKGEDNVEVLYAYRYTGADSEYVPAGGGEEVWNIQHRYITVIDQAQNITATINNNLSYVSAVDFQEHIDAATPHPNAPCLKAETTAPTGFWGMESDKHLHPMSVQTAQNTILGDSASTIPVLRSRLNQQEIMTANMALKMLAENECPDCPLTIAEDFKDPDMADTYSVKVTSIVAGDNGIDIQTDAGVIIGAWYWVSDGINSEYIQLKSVIKNGSVYRVLAVDNIQHTYTIANTSMYRTTALLLNGVATGAGDRKGQTWSPSLKFVGEKAAQPATVDIETSESKKDEYIISGDYMFTAANEASLVIY